MKITKKFLIKKNACRSAILKFEKENMEGMDAYKIIRILEEQKDSNGYIEWLFAECKLTGTCKGWYDNENLCYKNNYVKGKIHGTCKGWYPDGKLWYTKKYVKGKLHGTCKSWYSDGAFWYEDNYVKGKRHGTCKGWYPDGTFWEVNYIKGKMVKI